MSKHWQNRVLMDAASDAGGAGGSGASGGTSLLTASDGKGGAAPAAGGPAAGAAPNTGNAPTGNTGGGAAPQGNAVADWKLALPKELQENPSLKKFTDLSAMAGSYVSLEKLIGADKVVIPGQHATDDDWKKVFTKLGLPEDVTKYDVKFKEGISLQKDFVEEFKKTAHASGILPKQAQALADWFVAKNEGSEAQVIQMRKQQQDTAIDGLKTEWGKDFDFNVSRAKSVLSKFADKALMEYLDTSGLGSDANLVRLLSKVGGEMFKEDKIVNNDGDSVSQFSPSQARAEAVKIQADMKHPYNIKEHPGHKAAVDEVRKLYDTAFPSAQKSS